jgi:hypothetical protein
MQNIADFSIKGRSDIQIPGGLILVFSESTEPMVLVKTELKA